MMQERIKEQEKMEEQKEMTLDCPFRNPLQPRVISVNS